MDVANNAYLIHESSSTIIQRLSSSTLLMLLVLFLTEYFLGSTNRLYYYSVSFVSFTTSSSLENKVLNFKILNFFTVTVKLRVKLKL